MADIIQQGADWLTGKLEAYASRTVTYKRGASEVSVMATLGESLLKLDDGDAGFTMYRTERDYLIRTAALVGVMPPRRGDLIVDVDGTYEVMAPLGEPVYRSASPHGIMLRIHTKRSA